MNKEQTREERLKAIRQNILDSGRPNGYEYIEEYLVELETNWNELKEYLKGFDLERLHETCEHNLADTIEVLLDKMQEIESRK